MIDLYLSSSTDRGTRLKESLEGSLPGLKVFGPVLSGATTVERARYMADVTPLLQERYATEVDYDAVLRRS